MHFKGGLSAVHTDCVYVSCGQKISPSPRFLPFPERKRNPANLFTFPKCQDILGGLRVSAQSTRQLFYKKNLQAAFSFASSLALSEDRAAHLPGRLGQAWCVRGGWALLSKGRTADRRPGHPAGLAAGCAPGWSALGAGVAA